MNKHILGLVSCALWAGCLGAPQDAPPAAEAPGPGPTLTASFTGESVSTDQATYAVGGAIVASWSGLPGNAHDWIGLAPAGSDPTTVIRFTYTNGAASGSFTFEGVSPAGSYVVRAFVDGLYTQLAEAAFTVTGVTVATDRAAYAAGGLIVVSWSGLPGTATDWVSITPEGSTATTVTDWVYTGGATSGSHAFNTPAAAGRYVARAYPRDSYTIAGESAAFTSGVSITTDLTTYNLGDVIDVTWDLLPGNVHDWVGIAPLGSDPTTVTTWVYTNGATSGHHLLNGPPSPGTYVARAFVDDSYTMLAESASFGVQ
jgi:hypothetical protein